MPNQRGHPHLQGVYYVILNKIANICNIFNVSLNTSRIHPSKNRFSKSSFHSIFQTQNRSNRIPHTSRSYREKKVKGRSLSP